MAATKELLKESTKISNPVQVEEYMKKLQHPMKPVMETLRQIILAADKTVGEEIYWNAPSFFTPAK